MGIATHPKLPQKFHTVDGVAEFLDVSKRTVRRRIADGDLAVYRVGGQIRIADEDLARYLRDCREG